MTRKLFLTSAGLPPETVPSFLKLLGKDPKGLKLAFIPTAGYPEVKQEYVDEAREGSTKMGFDFEIVDLKEEPKSVKERLTKADVIFVNGGNTFFLLYWIRKCGLDKYLGELLDQGKIYIGVSAGSILVGPNIESSFWCHEPDINVVNLKDLTGLNLVPFTIVPHFIGEDLASLEEKAKTVDYPVIAINDTQAVQVVGNDYKIVGKGEEIIFGKIPMCLAISHLV